MACFGVVGVREHTVLMFVKRGHVSLLMNRMYYFQLFTRLISRKKDFGISTFKANPSSRLQRILSKLCKRSLYHHQKSSQSQLLDDWRLCIVHVLGLSDLIR